MATVSRFDMIRYNPDAVMHPGRQLAPPYDVIDDDDKTRLIESAPYNSVRIDKPAGGAEARELLDQWLDEGILQHGGQGMAIIQQRYTGPDGVRRTRLGVLCELGLEPLGSGTIHGHERTFDAPRTERQRLLTDSGINTSPVFVLYDDASNPLSELLAAVTDDEPELTARDLDGTQTAAWFVTDDTTLSRIEAAVSGNDMLIADGHHRYAAAFAAHEAHSVVRTGGGVAEEGSGTDGWNGVLAFVANSADPGIQVFPTHRVVSGVDPAALDEFVVNSGVLEAFEHDDVETAFLRLAALKSPGFAVYTRGRARTFAVPDPTDMVLAAPDATDTYRGLDVVALHELVLDGGAVLADSASAVQFTRSREEAVQAVDSGEADIAFLLREAPVQDVHAVARAGELLPQKSTYFYPKVPTGVSFRRVAPER